MKKKYAIIFAAFWAVVLGAGLGLKAYWNQGDRGVYLVPQREHSVEDPVLYHQRDERWSKDKLGDSSYTMGSSGCLTTCIASALSTQYQNTGTGREISPGELNQLFTDKGVYNHSGDIVWDKVKEALPEAEVLVASQVDPLEIEDLLDKGRYPIVKVKIGGNGAGHWVAIMETWDKLYRCMDPLDDSGHLTSLNDHESVAYRMRCVYWAD